MKAELDAKDRNVPLVKMHEEHQDEVEAWKATASCSEATLMMVREETSADIKMLYFKQNSAAVLHHELLASICHVVKAREQRKDNSVGTFLKQRKFYGKGHKVTAKVPLAD